MIRYFLYMHFVPTFNQIHYSRFDYRIISFGADSDSSDELSAFLIKNYENWPYCTPFEHPLAAATGIRHS
ncbi:MAG: hypothetical protein FWG30_07170, partial [Eubacteriaceae bacterium]|nr:hypothetical protein [Eubacteriaceae bacterium]